MVRGVDVSADGSLAVTCSIDRTACLWNLASGARIHAFPHSDPVWCVCIARDGTLVATGDGAANVFLFDAGNGQRLKAFRGHHESVGAIAMSADNTLLVTSDDTGVVFVWRTDTATALQRMDPTTTLNFYLREVRSRERIRPLRYSEWTPPLRLIFTFARCARLPSPRTLP